MNRADAAKLVAVIVATTPSQSHRLDARRLDEMVTAYASLLDDLTYEQCNAALRVLLQTRTWMPSVADIRSTVLEIQRGPQRAGGDAWGFVLQAVKREGFYRTPGVDFTFRDPIIARCVETMGWQELCLSENAVADRARFIELYDKLASNARREQQSPMLAGAREQREMGASTVGQLLPLLLKKSEEP